MPKETSSNNFRDLVQIQANGTQFFLGERKDKSKFCFPPADRPICDEGAVKDVFVSTRKLNIEDYRVSLSDLRPVLAEGTKELAYLVAAEVALQRGFGKFIVDHIYFDGKCSDSYGARTYGAVSGNIYQSRTEVTNRPICTGFLSMDVLIFNDYEEIKTGVFRIHPYSKELQPHPDLYFTSRDRYKLLNRDTDYFGKTRHSPVDAWKTYLDAAETARALRKKYKVESFQEYEIKPPILVKPTILDSLKKAD